MPVSIKNRWNNEIIATVDDTDDLREAVVRLVRQGVPLVDASLVGARLVDAKLNGARLDRASLDRASLDGASLVGARLDGARLDRASLDGASLVGARLDGARLVDASLDGASLDGASLVDARLDGARLDRASLVDAKLDGAMLDGASLVDARLDPIRDDLYAVLSFAPAEVPALIAALETGMVNGSTYCDGKCGCLVGTLAMAAGAEKFSGACSAVHGLKGNGSRPIERFFLAIKRGDTPDNSQFAKLAHQWATEWLDRMQAAFGPVKNEVAT